MIKPTLPDVASAVMVVCALVVTALVVRRELIISPDPVPAAEVEVSDWTEIAATGAVIGPEDAPIRIVEFSDFQCPFCARFRENLAELQRRHPDRVAVVYRHYPLVSIHPHAFAASMASECAARQGRFETYHDLLFADQENIGVRPWREFAEQAGVPHLARFERCVSSGETGARVREDVEAADRIGVDQTPAVLIDGRMTFGAASVEELEGRIGEALARR